MGKADAAGRQLRSQLDNRFMSSFTKEERENLWDTSDDELFRRSNKRIMNIMFPHDTSDKDKFARLCKEMSGDVVTYNIKARKETNDSTDVTYLKNLEEDNNGR